MLHGEPAARTNLRLQLGRHGHLKPGRNERSLPRLQFNRLAYSGIQIEAGSKLRHPLGKRQILVARQFFNEHLMRQSNPS